MTLIAASNMRRSASLKGRVESAALAHGLSIQWVDRNIAALCATPTWVTAWAAAYQQAISVGDLGTDLGARMDVIKDEDIDAAVADLADKQPDDTTSQASLAQQVADLTAKVADLEQRAQAAEATTGTTAATDTAVAGA